VRAPFYMKQVDVKKTQLPDTPGIYFFLGPKREILYIGKATSLKSRVRSYFNSDITESRGPAIARMLDEAYTVAFEKTDSVLEALILEAIQIKKHQPPYNTKEKSDKSFNYVIITDEEFPRVLLMREKELHQNKEMKVLDSFGPFPQGAQLREALKIVRKIFPFRDGKCTPDQSKPCFNRQIGLCPGTCTGDISKREYRKIITKIKLFFSGKKKQVIKKLEQEMKQAAKEKRFENAAEIRKQIFALNHIHDISLLKKSEEFPRDSALRPVASTESGMVPGSSPRQSATLRVEAYDIAHLAGSNMVGVMTVVEDGEVNKNEYRKFNIKSVTQSDDTAALAEVLQRRFGHPEWPYPELIVIDGGKAQKNRAEKEIKSLGMDISVVSVVKDEKHKPRDILGISSIKSLAFDKKELEREILLANNEAHRFAITFHRQKRRIR